MIYTAKIRKAIDVVSLCHHGQLRRDGNYYVIHSLTVGLILSRVTTDEDLVCAGILHDVIEESKYELNKLEDEFGECVAKIVGDLTDDMTQNWATRKGRTLEMLKTADNDTLLVKSADFLSNMVDYLYLCNGNRKLQRNFTTDNKSRIEDWSKRVEILNNRWLDNPLLQEINESMKEVLATQHINVDV